MTKGQHISEEDLALFAMGSLDAVESSTVEAHRASCQDCSKSLSEVLGDLALLGLSVDQLEMPAGARERFAQRIASEPRGVVANSGSASDRTGSASADSTRSRAVPFLVPTPPARRPLTTALPWMLAAAMLAAAAYLGSEVSQLRTSRDQARSEAIKLASEAARAQEVLEVLTAPTAQQVTLTEGKPAPAPTGRTSYLASRGGLVFVANNLHPLPASKAYELWVIPANGQAPIPAGTFRPDDHGIASLVLPSLPVGVVAKAFGVTIERAEGSPTPTSPIILSGS